MSQPSPAGIPLPFQLSRLIGGYWVAQAIHAAAVLGVADALAGGPRRSEEIAAAVGAHPGALRRLLRALAAIELCRETDEGGFELTPLGTCLRSDSPDSVRSWALLMGGGMVWRSWGHLADCVRTGEPAPRLLDGLDTFEFIAAHPEEFAVFDRSMAELTRRASKAVAAAYDFSGLRRVVDVGGGFGALLTGILEVHPGLTGVVYDLEHCREGADRLAADAGLAGRVEFVAGSFFDSVPSGADAYLIKSVIHDWDDERSLAILGACRAAMGPEARLLLIEVMVPERAGTSPMDQMIAGTDLNMLTMTGGLERTEAEYRVLLRAAGLAVTRVVPTPSAFSVVEARHA